MKLGNLLATRVACLTIFLAMVRASALARSAKVMCCLFYCQVMPLFDVMAFPQKARCLPRHDNATLQRTAHGPQALTRTCLWMHGLARPLGLGSGELSCHLLSARLQGQARNPNAQTARTGKTTSKCCSIS